MANQDFIKKMATYAMEDMRNNKILASLTMAQAILESGWGKSGVTVNANNLFGIKGKHNGQFYLAPTKEFQNGKWVDIIAAFKKYPSWQESVSDHSRLFNKYFRYRKLRGCTDYKLACKYIAESGYASDPDYENLILNLIVKHKLYEYDNIVLNEVTVEHKVVSGDTLWKVSAKYLGSGIHYKKIMTLNGLKSNIIQVGEVLKIPKK